MANDDSWQGKIEAGHSPILQLLNNLTLTHVLLGEHCGLGRTKSSGFPPWKNN